MTYIDEKTSKSINQSRRRRGLHRVPVQLRQNKKHIYEPVVVPLGPYHHRQHPRSHLVEPLNNELKNIVCNHNEYPLVSNIYKRIDEICNFYGGANGYNGWDLAKIMLRDTCFLICYMQEGETHTLIRQRMGMSGVLFMNPDVFMLENQIPLWLISLIHPDHQSLLREFLNNNVCGNNNKLTQLPWGDGRGEEHLHLLEAVHRTSFILDETQENSSILLRLIKKSNHPRNDWQMMNNNTPIDH